MSRLVASRTELWTCKCRQDSSTSTDGGAYIFNDAHKFALVAGEDFPTNEIICRGEWSSVSLKLSRFCPFCKTNLLLSFSWSTKLKTSKASKAGSSRASSKKGRWQGGAPVRLLQCLRCCASSSFCLLLEVPNWQCSCQNVVKARDERTQGC